MTNHTIEDIYKGNGRISWRITFSSEPQDGEVEEIIEKTYPSPGYGPSTYTKTIEKDGFYIVFVSSNDSCD